MFPPVSEWDEAEVLAAATSVETLEVEKKASPKFDLSSKKAQTETKSEMAKQICAFSNSGRGFLIYGITDTGSLDGGVDERIPGGNTAKWWIEQVVPALVKPPVHGCQAKHIHMPSRHAPGLGVLVIEIPLSDRRPHWVVEGNCEVPYIRAGEHSARMTLQTFRDISSHGDNSQGEVLGAGVLARSEFLQHRSIHVYTFNPFVRLLSGPTCDRWLVELRVTKNEAVFRTPPPANGRVLEPHVMVGCPPKVGPGGMRVLIRIG